MTKMKVCEYWNQLHIEEMPSFLLKYLKCPSLIRLQKIGFFCGMDYASKDIYPFEEFISRYHHSLSCALLTWRLTNNKVFTLASLFHDISTPCFSHVIDYLNGDYIEQESTEKYTEKILREDPIFQKYLEEDNISVEEIINFKQYSIVDSKRPKLCIDRMDGIILASIGLTKSLTLEDLTQILSNLCIYLNEEEEMEIGFQNFEVCQKVIEFENKINAFFHSKEDNYMMFLLAHITKYALSKGYLSYSDLYHHQEEEVFSYLKELPDSILQEKLQEFQTIRKEEIQDMDYPATKQRKLRPLVRGVRI